MVFWPCDFEANKETARFVIADRFVDFLHDEYGEQRFMEMVNVAGDSVTRRWFRWRKETSDRLIDVFGVDKFMTQVLSGELMVNDLPADCFSFAKIKRKSGRLSKEVRDEAVLRVLGGEPTDRIARELNRSYSCVNKWVNTYKKAQAA